jgi:hypothetical protein
MDINPSNFLSENLPEISIHEMIILMLEWVRKYAQETNLGENLIAKSMKGYLTPIPEVATALGEEIESNVNKLLDANLYSPLAMKERNNRIESLKDTRDKTITKVSEYYELNRKLFDALNNDSLEYSISDNNLNDRQLSFSAKKRLRWQMICTNRILSRLIYKNESKIEKIKLVLENIEKSRGKKNIFQTTTLCLILSLKL